MFEFLRLAARKAGLVLAVFFLASSLLFFAIRAIPGDPIALRQKFPDKAHVEEERARLGLDRPVLVQWWNYVRSFVAGDWGQSLRTGRTVRAEVARCFPATIELSAAAVLIGLCVGVAAAVGAEVFRLGALRWISFLLGMTGMTVPIFWIGLLEIVVGTAWLGWFPASGRFDPIAVMPPDRTGFQTIDALLAGDFASLATTLHYLALPALCLSVYPAAQVCAVLQARLQDRRLLTLVTSLRARGLSPARIWLRHVLKVVSAPVITAIGSTFGTLLGGAVLTETVFGWPGIGGYLVEAVKTRDLYVVQNGLLLVVLLVVAVVFASDFVAYLINPVTARGGVNEDDDEKGGTA